MKKDILSLWWTNYLNYIRKIILPDSNQPKDISYWRDAAFTKLLTYLAPIGLIALIPGVYMSLKTGFVVVGATDLLAFILVLVIILNRSLKISQRKIIFLSIFYCLSLVLIDNLITSGVGLLYLLALTVVTGIIYSPRAAYVSALVNTIICIGFAFLFHFNENTPNNNGYTTAAWIAVSSNLVLLSFVCAQCLILLLNGLETSINDKLAADDEMKLLHNRLLLATKSAGMGIWDWDIINDHMTWDDGMYQLYQTDDLKYSSVYIKWLLRLHPDDRDTINAEIQNAIAGIKDYNTEFRIVWADMAIRYIRATGTVERDNAGRAMRMIGANWDITNMIKQQEQLILSEANLSAIIESADANIYSLDKDFRYITFNNLLKKSVKQNYDIDINPGDKVFDFLEKSAPHEAREWEYIYTEALSGKPLKFEKEFNVGGQASTTSFSIIPIFKNTEVIGLSCFAVDVTDIKKARTEIQTLNASLELKVAERTAELENANKELEAFSYSVSHDLRAPVRSVLGFVKIIKEEHSDSLSEDVKEMFSYIENSNKRMSAIIDDLFVLAKYGKEKLVYSDVDLNALFSAVWDNLLFTSPHHAVLDMEQMPTIRADSSMLQQVVVNMLSNAIKYSSKKEHPKIKVGFTKKGGTVTVYVKDNGAGFDMQFYDRLFGAFQRLHGISEFEGTGVGLMLAKKIIEKHNGEVWAEGKVNEGATFYFSLPMAA